MLTCKKLTFMSKLFFISLIFFVTVSATSAQPANNTIPVSNADLGTFPYFKTPPNFKPLNESDSVTIQQNQAYFFNGKSFITIEGQVSSQKINVIDDKQKIPSEFQIVQEFDKMIETLGGKKIYAGKLPEEELRKVTTTSVVDLVSKHQLAPSAYYGVVEYVIKTSQKEVWVQLVPGTIGSNFYNILVVEKQTQLLTTNTNKENILLKELEKNGKVAVVMNFGLDSSGLLTESKDELLSIVGIYQAHPDWKLKLDVHNAPVGKPEYVLALTEKRSSAIKDELVSLGVKPGSLEAKGLGDTKPLVQTKQKKQGR